MTAPFVISMKIAGDSSSAVSATGALRQELNELNKQIVQTSAGAGSSLQQRINAMVGVGGSGASGRGADIAAYGAELDRLRAKYNPLFSVIRQYRTELGEIRDANRFGAISEDEMAAAINRRRTATLAAIQAIKSGSPAPNSAGAGAGGAGSFQTANIAAQLQDVIVTGSMPGSNALTIALQQGPQLSAILEQLKGQGKSTGAALLGAFTSILSPMSLATIGAVALGAVTLQAFAQVARSGETAGEAIDRYAAKISSVVTGYKDAETAVKDWADAANQAPREVVLSNLQKQFTDANKELERFQNKVGAVNASSHLWLVGDDANEANAQLHEALQLYAAGKTSATDLQIVLTRIANTDFGLINYQLNALATELADGADKAAALQNIYIALEHAAATTGTDSGTKFGLDGYVEGQKSAAGHQLELDAINAKSPAQLADIARRRTALELDGQAITESLRKQKIDEAGALAYAQASRGLLEADRNRLRALHDSVDAQQLALDVIGMSVGETERLTFARQNLAAAEAEAAQNGTTVSAAYRAEVERLAASYGKLQEAIALRKLGSDLQFDRQQLFRSPIEQTVASTLRPIFGDDLTSAQALFAANQIRVNEQLKEMNDIGRDITGGFLSTLKSDLLSGTSLFGALGNAGVSALDKIADRALDMAADGLWNMIFGAIGGSLFGGGFGSLGNDVGSGATFGGVQNFLKSATGNAAGTDYWRGGLTAANENGRGEIFDLPNGTRIIPHDVSMEMARGAAGNFTFAPTSHFIVQGGQADLGAYRELLDERDRQMNEQFEQRVAAYLANPNRRSM